MPFARPDFGFNDYLTFEQPSSGGSHSWKKFMDCFAIVPKYERVKNYIEFVNNKKVENLPSELRKKLKKQDSVRVSQLEMLRQIHLNKSI